MNQFIPVNEPLLNGNEKKYLIECIDTGWISSDGPFVSLFEEKFAKKMGRKYGIAVCNGTAAIDAAITALDLKSGDEIIMPAFTIISCVNQIIRIGAVPILIDSDPVTWNMNVLDIEKKITNKTKAIFPVHIYGHPVDMDPILDLSKKYNLKVIEDAAEMHGQYYKNRPCGSFGDVSIFSFYPNKHITTGEGGMILTDSDEIYHKCLSLRNLCFQPNNRFVHENLGWNLRMTNMQAAIGLAQLERLEEFIKIKKRIGHVYTNAFSNFEWIELPKEQTNYSDNIYWVFGIVNKRKDLDAKKIMHKLTEIKIGSRPFFCPMHIQPVLKNMGHFKDESYPVSENLYKNGFYIPSGLGLTENMQNEVISRISILLNNI